MTWLASFGQSVEFNSEEGHIHISDLEIYDEEAVDFLSEMDEGEQVELVERVVKIGLTAGQLMDTSQEVE